MPTERVVEIPWVLAQLPQTGRVLDVGSCDATYLADIASPDRTIHCLDVRDCPEQIPQGAEFHHQDFIGNTLAAASFDAVLAVSVLEHIGLPYYDQPPFGNGDRLALAEIRRLLKPTGRALVTVPAGHSKIASWYRQYSPMDLQALFQGWSTEMRYWAFNGAEFVAIEESHVTNYDYREPNLGAGAVAAVLARPVGEDTRTQNMNGIEDARG